MTAPVEKKKKKHSDKPQWEKDFPVVLGQDHFVARRDFTKVLALTSFVLFAGQVWLGVQNTLRRKRGLPTLVPIAELQALAVGSATAFHYPTADDPCLLLRPDESTLVAFSQQCTHLSCAVTPDPKALRLNCPCHNGSFDLATGWVLGGPPRRGLTRIALEVRRGTVYAAGIERSST